MGYLVSVIIPIYNVDTYLAQCIESICRQSFPDLEIILVDDGSTDGSGVICDSYAEKDVRIRVIHKQNGGLVSARKAGLSVAAGDYILCVDGDDWIEPDMVSRMLNVILRENADIVLCGFFENAGSTERIVRHGVLPGRYDKAAMTEGIYSDMFGGGFFEWRILPHVWGKLFRRNCLLEPQLGVDDRVTMGEDVVCVYRCILGADSIFIMDEPLYHYRQSGNSMIKKIGNRKRERETYRLLYQSMQTVFAEWFPTYNLQEQIKRYMLFLMVPRAEALYEGFGELDWLFPFPQVKRGMRIVLYCAGTYGQRLYRYLTDSGFCQVAAWVDRNWQELRSMGLAVDEPSVIADVEYDAIVIANIFEPSRSLLYKELAGRYGSGNVHMIDEACVFSEETWQAFPCGDDTISRVTTNT